MTFLLCDGIRALVTQGIVGVRVRSCVFFLDAMLLRWMPSELHVGHEGLETAMGTTLDRGSRLCCTVADKRTDLFMLRGFGSLCLLSVV